MSTQKTKTDPVVKPASIVKNPESTAEDLAPLVGSSQTIDRLLAKHPNAGAALLEKLSHSSDKATRKNVCLNPNIMKQTFMRIALAIDAQRGSAARCLVPARIVPSM